MARTWRAWMTIVLGVVLSLTSGEVYPAPRPSPAPPGGITPLEMKMLGAFRPTFQKMADLWRLSASLPADQGFEAVRQVHEKSPNLAPGIDLYVFFAQRAERLPDALAFFTTRSQIRGEGPMPLYALARVHLAAGRPVEASEEGKRAMEAGCVYWGCASVLAQAWRAAGQVDAGEGWIQQRLPRARAETRGTLLLALAELHGAEPVTADLALEDLEKARAQLRFGRGLERALLVEGRLLTRLGRFEEARVALERAMVAFEAMGDEPSLADVGLAMGEVELRLGRPSQVRAALERPLVWLRASGQARASWQVAGLYAQACAQEGRLLEMQQVLEQVQEEATLAGEGAVADAALLDTAKILLDAGVGPSHPAVARAMETPPGALRGPAELRVRLALLRAQVLEEGGRPAEATQALGEALAAAGDPASRAALLAATARLHAAQGDTLAAMRAWLAAEQATDAEEEVGLRFEAAIALAEGSLRMGLPRRALASLAAGVAELEAEGVLSPAMEVTVDVHLAQAWALLGEQKKAEDLAAQALKRAWVSPLLAAEVLVRSPGPPAAGVEELAALVEMLPAAERPVERAAALAARSLAEQGPARAARLADALALLSAGPDTARALRAWAGGARSCVLQEQVRLALGWELLRQDKPEEVRALLKVGGACEGEEIRWLPPQGDRAALAAAAVMPSPGAPVEGEIAWEALRIAMVEGGARAPAPAQARAALTVAAALSSGDPTSQREVLAVLGGAAPLANAALPAPVTAQIAAAAAGAIDPALGVEGLLQLAAALQGGAAAAPPTAIPPLTAIQSALGEGRALLVLLPGQGAGRLFLIDGMGAASWPLPSRAEWAAPAMAFDAAARDPERPVAEIAAAGQQLFTQLLGPASTRILAARSLVVLARGELSDLPLEALVLPGELARPRWLGATLALAYTPELGRWLPAAGQGPSSGPVLVVADPTYQDDRCGLSPARRTRVAADSRTALLGDEWQRLCTSPGHPQAVRDGRKRKERRKDGLLSGGAASEAGVWQATGQPWATLHLATHAVVRGDSPQARAVVAGLVPDEQAGATPWVDDAYLDGAELARSRWTPSAVVLPFAAELGGEGPFPLAEDLHRAGVDAVVITRHRVDDQAQAVFVTHLYRAWRSHPPEEALRLARAALIDGAAGPAAVHPWYWSAATLSVATF